MTVIEARQGVIYERRGRIDARELWEQMNTGIGEPLWNAFHNCSVAPQNHRSVSGLVLMRLF